jgi:hypothetical protein
MDFDAQHFGFGFLDHLVTTPGMQFGHELIVDDLRHAGPDVFALLGGQLDPAAGPFRVPVLAECDLDRIELDEPVASQ